ncbi:MAG: SMP-30/gluconolactonase/LRE family protein [Bryobacteraceae bacterium]
MILSRLVPSLLFSAATAQDFSNIRIERFTTGFLYTEGPVWSEEGFLLYSDVPAGKIWTAVPGKKPVVYREMSGGAHGNDFDAQGRLFTCEATARRVTRTDRRGKIEVIAENWEGKRLNAPNDIVVRRDGHAWFTDPAFGSQADARELDFYGVYHIPPKGPVELVARPQGRPNGLALSANGRMLYVTNADERNVRVYDLDRAGKASGERVLISGIAGPANGICVDEKGSIFVMAAGVQFHAPDGKHLYTAEMPETPSNCTFGDEDLMTLYITARTSIYRIRWDVKGAVQH